MKTVYLNAAYFPGVELLSALVTAGILVLRRRAGDRGRRHGRRAGRVRRGAEQLLRPDPAALAALHDLPGGHGGARQDLRAARRGARPRRRARTRSSSPRLRGELRFEDVSLRATAARTPSARCDDIDLHVPPGQTVALVGATGAGKSTFAKLVARFYDPTEGRVLVDGHDLRDVAAALAALADGHRPAGGVPVQRHDPREHRVRPRRTATRRGPRSRPPRARSARTTSSRRSSTATTRQVGERGAQLSAGQRQLVAFARALIADPRILVLDEATSNVDIHTESRIEAGLRRLLAGRTAIVIAHRLSTIQRAGRIVVLDHGRIVEQGTHEELLARGGRLLAALPRLGRAGRGVAHAGSRPSAAEQSCGAGTRTPTSRLQSAGVLPLARPRTWRGRGQSRRPGCATARAEA